MLLRVLIVVLLSVSPVFGQQRPSFDFGLRAGKPGTSVVGLEHDQYYRLFGGTDFMETSNYAVGPTFAVNLTDHLAIQLDALYKPVRYTTTGPSQPGFYSQRSSTRGHWWEFPLMAKGRFGRENVQPFAGGGISFNHATGTTESFYTDVRAGTETRSSRPLGMSGSWFGLVAGGGVELKAGNFQIAPELRYTHWRRTSYGPGTYALPNQFDLLVGFTFRK